MAYIVRPHIVKADIAMACIVTAFYGAFRPYVVKCLYGSSLNIYGLYSYSPIKVRPNIIFLCKANIAMGYIGEAAGPKIIYCEDFYYFNYPCDFKPVEYF